MKKDLIQIITLYNSLSTEDKDLFNKIFNIPSQPVSVKVNLPTPRTDPIPDYNDILRKFNRQPLIEPIIQPYTLTNNTPKFEPLDIWCGLGKENS